MSTRYRIETLRIESPALAGNPLGDPAVRELPLLVPEPDGEEATGRAWPLVFVLAGFSGIGRSALADDPWSEGLGRRVERLEAEGRLGPMIYALPDAFTRYGGSQYLDSPATGRYEQYLWTDLLGAIRARYPIGRVGLVGKSSGSYGALVQAMRHPEIVSACACHAADMYFEYSCIPDFPRAFRTISRHGGVDGFLAHFAASHKKRSGGLMEAINVIAMASCYSPAPGAPHGFDLPFDLQTGALRPDVWQRWLAWDPIHLVEDPRHQAALAKLRLLYLDAGNRDEYALDVGARVLAARLRALGIAHTHEEFEDGHMAITWRYDVSLPLLWQALR